MQIHNLKLYTFSIQPYERPRKFLQLSILKTKIVQLTVTNKPGTRRKGLQIQMDGLTGLRTDGLTE